MSILCDENTRLMVQGITGRNGRFHTEKCMEYGTNVVAGVSPGKAGQDVNGAPVFDTAEQAVKETGANASIIFVPAPGAADAIMEATDAGLELIVCITEGIPVMDMIKVVRYMEGKSSRLVGPNCPGVITPGAKCKLGIMPGFIHQPGVVGIISRSGTLTYEAVDQTTRAGLGQSTCVGIGGDPVAGTGYIDLLELFEKDPRTEAVLMIGEIGGTAEEEAAWYIKDNVTKPVVGFVAGKHAPPGKRMGHAGAIISGGKGTQAEKVKALEAAGVHVVENAAEMGKTVAEVLER